ncbi:MAG: hypothetical protein Q8R20_00910 [Nanoarchaeota archaeon]|nr:hypothetical protein [Nanoarchaeota archaeon]
MPTTKTRINLSVPDILHATLEVLAERDSVTPTTKALELLKKGMELEEDEVLNAIAEERAKHMGKWLSHEEVWK